MAELYDIHNIIIRREGKTIDLGIRRATIFKTSLWIPLIDIIAERWIDMRPKPCVILADSTLYKVHLVTQMVYNDDDEIKKYLSDELYLYQFRVKEEVSLYTPSKKLYW